MTWTRSLCGLTLLGCAAGSALSQSPLSAENLLFAPPQDYKAAFHSTRGNSEITEYVPAGQTVEDWTEMTTVQLFRGATVDPASFLKGIGSRYMNDCPGTTAKGVFTGQANGYVVSMLLLKCPNNPATGKPETTGFRVFKGSDALYCVQHAWRSVPTDAEVDVAMHALAKTTLCDTRTAEHPCPALTPVKPQ